MISKFSIKMYKLQKVYGDNFQPNFGNKQCFFQVGFVRGVVPQPP